MSEQQVDVRRLHLRVPAAGDAARALFLVEDAFRIASWPWVPPGALLVVRHLVLDGLRLDAPSQALAARLSELLRDLVRRAVPGASARASGAPAVWFASVPAARAALASSILGEGAPRTAWYWPDVCPGYRPDQPAARTLALALELPPPIRATEPPALVAAAELLLTLAEAGRLLPVLLRVPGVGALGHAWAPVLRAPPPPMGAAPPLAPDLTAPPALHAPHADALAEVVRRFGPVDARARVVAAATLLGARPTLARNPELPRLVSQVIEGASYTRHLIPVPEPRARVLAPVGDAVGDGRVAPPLPHPPSQAAVAEPSAAQGGSVSAVQDTPPASPPPARAADPIPRRADPPQRPPWWLDPRADPWPDATAARLPDIPLRGRTAIGGLLFVVPLLDRLGLGAEEDDALGWRVLAELVRRLAPPMDDGLPPVIEAAGPFPPDEAPARRLDWVRRVVEALPGARDDLDLETLARRPALVAATRTHIDLVLPFSSVDLRIRRRALDVDPGWVPWLGRVLTWHYIEDEDWSRLAAALAAAPPG